MAAVSLLRKEAMATAQQRSCPVGLRSDSFPFHPRDGNDSKARAVTFCITHKVHGCWTHIMAVLSAPRPLKKCKCTRMSIGILGWESPPFSLTTPGRALLKFYQLPLQRSRDSPDKKDAFATLASHAQEIKETNHWYATHSSAKLCNSTHIMPITQEHSHPPIISAIALLHPSMHPPNN